MGNDLILRTFLFSTKFRLALGPNQPPPGDSFCNDKVAKAQKTWS